MRVPRVLAVVALLAAVGTAAAVASPESSASRWCRATTGAAWERVFARHVVALSRHASLVPLAGGGDGRTFFAEEHSAAFSGIVRVDARTSRTTPIVAFHHPGREQAEASFDGRWLVWTVLYSPANLSAEGLWAWDSRTGRTRTIAVTPSPEHSIGLWAARDSIVAWDSRRALRMLDERSGRVRVLGPGHVSSLLVLDGGIVAWTRAGHAGAASARTGRAVAVPRGLAALGARVFASDGAGLVGSSGPRTLLWSSAPGSAPVPVVTTRDILSVTASVGGGYVLFSAEPHSYLAQLRTRRYVELPTGGGFGRLDAKALVFLEPSPRKARHAVADVAFIPLRELPRFAACAR